MPVFETIGGVGGAGRGVTHAPSLPAANSMCLFGDSYMANSDPAFFAPNLTSQLTIGTWLNILTGYRLRLPQQYNFGVAGDITGSRYDGAFTQTQPGMMSRCGPGPLSSGTDICVMSGGGNDVHAFTTFADAVLTPAHNLQTMARAMLDAGMAVIYPSLIPRIASTATQLLFLQALNELMKRYAEQNRGFYYVDMIPLFCDPTAATMAPRANYMAADGHPSVLGCFYYGNQIATVINNAITPWFKPTFSASDTFDQTNNPYGNRLPNGMLIGTGGTSVGATGTIAASTTVDVSTAAAGVTATCSIAAMADGSNGQQIVLSGTSGTVAQIFVDQTVAAAGFNNLVPGEVLEGSVAFESTTAASTLCAISPVLQVTDNAVGFQGHGAAPREQNIASWPALAIAGTVRTPRYTVATTSVTALSLRQRIYIRTSLAQSGTLRIGQLSLRKIN